MIEIIVGRLGGGKTCNAVARLVKYLAQGGIVVTNISLNWEAVCAYCRKRWGSVLDEKQLIAIADEDVFHHEIPRGKPGSPTLVCVDEAHLWFDQFGHSEKGRRELMAFLSQSRHVDVDVLLISQSELNMDRSFLRLVQYVWRYRDMQRLKMPVLGIYFPLPYFMAFQYDYDGKTLLDRKWIRKDGDIFRLYNTRELYRTFPLLDSVEANGFRRLSASERWKLGGRKMKAIAILVAMLGLVTWGVSGLVGSKMGGLLFGEAEASEEDSALTRAVLPPSPPAVTNEGPRGPILRAIIWEDRFPVRIGLAASEASRCEWFVLGAETAWGRLLHCQEGYTVFADGGDTNVWSDRGDRAGRKWMPPRPAPRAADVAFLQGRGPYVP